MTDYQVMQENDSLWTSDHQVCLFIIRTKYIDSEYTVEDHRNYLSLIISSYKLCWV